MKLSIVLPAYNEEKMLGKVLQSLPKKLDRISKIILIVIDDGSIDDTSKIANKNKAIVINHIINNGQGAALKTGLEYIKKFIQPDIVVTFDSDGQHDPNDIKKLIAPIINKQTDIVLGSRFIKRSSSANVPMLKKIVLKAGVCFTNIISHIKLTDTHNGLRALNKKAYSSINITQKGMEHASEIIDEISRNKLRYMEIPVNIIYSEYSINKGQKISNFFKIGIKTIIHKIIS